MTMGKFATIQLDLYKGGIRAYCQDLSDCDDLYEEFIPRGDGQALIDFINEVDELTNPDTVFALTEKGKNEAKKLNGDDELKLFDYENATIIQKDFAPKEGGEHDSKI